MQRAAFDLLGIARRRATTSGRGCATARWPVDAFPLRARFRGLAERGEPGEDDYPFVRVEGDGVHEIPVGPCTRASSSPGISASQVVGEKVLRLEERLGYTHKGIEKRFESHDARRRRIGSPAACPAIRPSPTPGPTRMALECARGVDAAAARAWLRALLLERERIANHLGDLGFLGNDARLRVRARAVLAPEGRLAARRTARRSAIAF